MTASSEPSVPLARALDAVSGATGLDVIGTALEPGARRLATGGLGRLLRGEAVGHPLHPALTDLPIGFWTSAFVLDLIGGPQDRGAARKLVGLGVLSVVPTAAAGLADWSGITRPSIRRVGVMHAVTNTAATACYAASWWARRRRRHPAGVAFGLAGATLATMAGFLGGHLAFGSSEP